MGQFATSITAQIENIFMPAVNSPLLAVCFNDVL